MRHDERAAVGIIVALLMTLICGFVALAIDIGRSVTVATRLEQILDTAALAGARLLDEDDISDSQIADRVTRFVEAQAPILGIPPTVLANLTVTIDRTANSVTATAKGNLQTTFASVIGFKTVDVGKSATVVYHMKDVELALVLDTTGSMADVPAGDTVSKIDSLKTAANTVVETLFSQAVNDRGIRIAVAPFSSSVNVGSYASSTIASSGGFYSSFYASFASTGTNSGCAVERTGVDNTTDAGPYGYDKLRDLSTVGASGNACPSASVLPLTGRSQQVQIKKIISNFSPNGSTAGHIGAAWGWYLLSPNWNGIFTGANAPGAYRDSNVNKNLVLMTDGLFNTSYLTAPPVGSAAATQESYAQFRALCTNMKNNGITIYTVGFGLTDPAAATELGNCASSSANFFSAANGSELQSAFASIVAKLNQLRVAR